MSVVVLLATIATAAAQTPNLTWQDVCGCAGYDCAARLLPLGGSVVAALCQSNQYENLYAVSLIDTNSSAPPTVVLDHAALKAAGAVPYLNAHTVDPASTASTPALILAARRDNVAYITFANLSNRSGGALRHVSMGIHADDDRMSAASAQLTPCLTPPNVSGHAGCKMSPPQSTSESNLSR